MWEQWLEMLCLFMIFFGSGSSLPRAQTNHFNHDTWVLLYGYHAAMLVSHGRSGLFWRLLWCTPKDQVTASSPNLNPVCISEEPETQDPTEDISPSPPIAGMSTVMSLNLSSITACPLWDSERCRKENKDLLCLSSQYIQKACWPDCQYFTISVFLNATRFFCCCC